ncbi:MAG: HDOD domain-containing protein [Actinomycetota bacterium]
MTETATPGILFVDDEPDLLAGLRSSLRRLRRTYTFHFANGGDEAIRILRNEPIDLVVSDMRMPGMNGVQLLRHVKEHHPGAIRYVLSGEAEEHLVVQAVTLAHRWLSKPLDRDDLVAAIEEAMHHRTILDDAATAEAIARVDALASPPTLYAQVMHMIADTEASAHDLAEVVGTDAAISAKVLQWANSAFGAGHCDDVQSAIVQIGLPTVAQLVLLAEVFRAAGPHEAVPGLEPELLRRHVERIAAIADVVRPDDHAAHLGGLLSHIGLLIQATHLPERLAASYEHAEVHGTTLVAAEQTLHGITHPELGAFLLATWGLPSDVVLAVRDAFEPLDADGEATPRTADAVRIARLLAQREPHAEQLGRPHLDEIDSVTDATLDRWAVDEERSAA